MGVTFLSGDEKFVVANLGGLVENENVGDICCQYFYYKLLNFYLTLQKYIAMGFGNDKNNLQNLDVAVCTRHGKYNYIQSYSYEF